MVGTWRFADGVSITSHTDESKDVRRESDGVLNTVAKDVG